MLIGPPETPKSPGSRGRVHRAQVVHPFVEWRDMDHWVRQPCAALIPRDEPRIPGKLLEKCGKWALGLVQQFDVAGPTRDPDQRGVAVAQYAIGEPNVSVSCVVHVPNFHVNSLAVASSAAT